MQVGEFDPELTEPHVRNAVLLEHVRLLGERVGEARVAALVEEAGLSMAYLEDQERWMSRWFGDRFTALAMERLFDHRGDLADHPLRPLLKEASIRRFRPEGLGLLFYPVRSLGSPRRVYQRLPSLVARANRVIAVSSEEVGPTRFTFALDHLRDDGGSAMAWTCWSFHGTLAGVPRIWHLPEARVFEHHCALMDGGSVCRYEVTFAGRGSRHVVSPLLAALFGGIAGLGAAAAVGIEGGSIVGLTGALAAALGATLPVAIRSRSDAVRATTELLHLLNEADERYEAMWLERRELWRALLANRKIARYLPEDVVEGIMNRPEAELELGGVRSDGVVLFTDIVGFSQRCEGLDPEQVITDLNLYFATVDPVAERFDGVIDKRLGDGLMIVFTPRGAVEDFPSLVKRAVGCALGMLASVPECNRRLAEVGSAPISVRAGLTGGSLVQGNLGSAVKVEYTVVGDVVNLAARLEGRAAPGCLVLPKSVYALLDDPPTVVREATVNLRGRTGEVEIVEIASGG